jgi:hypothetical protein
MSSAGPELTVDVDDSGLQPPLLCMVLPRPSVRRRTARASDRSHATRWAFLLVALRLGQARVRREVERRCRVAQDA